MAWQRDNFARRKREKTTGKRRNGLNKRNFPSVHGDVMQVTPRGTGCMRGLKAGEVQSHCKAPLVLYQKSLTNTFLRLLPCHSHTGHLPSARAPGAAGGRCSQLCPICSSPGMGLCHHPFPKSLWTRSWWVPYRGQHGIFEWSYLIKAGFDIREDFSN